MRHAKQKLSNWNKPAVSLCLTVWLLLQLAMAGSEPLHKFFHKDADRAGHECAVTLLAHGQVQTSAVEVPVILPPAGIALSAPEYFSHVTCFCSELPSARGPPSSCLAS